ncbi:MAG TPA: TIGR03032 family protein, partial [Nannocystis sp.]
MADRLEVLSSRHFPALLAELDISLAFTTYQAGKLFLVGTADGARLSLFERTFPRCMGLGVDGDSLWLSTLFQLWRLDNTLPKGHVHEGYDRLYVPRVAHTTGDLDIHDLAVDRAGRPVFVNTLFSCLATLSPRESFAPLWRPPFISRLVPEDRCHLNGLAMHAGAPAFVTVVSASDVPDGWRDHRQRGGLVLHVPSGAPVLTGLSMPHSPRVHTGALWLLEAGTGYLLKLDLSSEPARKIAPASSTLTRVCFCPGYARGLAFAGPYAFVGLSKPRKNRTFAGLELDTNLAARSLEPRCGLVVVDTRTGDIVHWLRLEGVVEELYDVAVLPGVRRPMALGLVSEEIQRTITIGDPAPLFAPT